MEDMNFALSASELKKSASQKKCAKNAKSQFFDGLRPSIIREVNEMDEEPKS